MTETWELKHLSMSVKQTVAAILTDYRHVFTEHFHPKPLLRLSGYSYNYYLLQLLKGMPHSPWGEEVSPATRPHGRGATLYDDP